MNQKHREKANRIRSQATILLQSKGIEEKLKSLGALYYTGSYELDLMTWNDIDMQLVTDKDPVETLSKMMEFITQDKDLIEVRLIKMLGAYKPKMPRGVYLGIILNSPELGGEWKLDVWILEEKAFSTNRQLLASLKEKLTAENKELILEMKHELMAESYRVPQMSSHLLYQAILLEEITDKKILQQRFGLG